MKVGKISEEERAEIVAALQDRREALGKLADATEKRGVPTDHIDERLALYLGNADSPGLLRLFGVQPELQDEKRHKGEERRDDGQQDLYGGGVETGGAPREPDGKGPKGEALDPSKEVTAISDKARLLANKPQPGALIRWPSGQTSSIARVIRADGDDAWVVEDAEDQTVIVKRKRGKWIPEDAAAYASVGVAPPVDPEQLRKIESEQKERDRKVLEENPGKTEKPSDPNDRESPPPPAPDQVSDPEISPEDQVGASGHAGRMGSQIPREETYRSPEE